MSRTVTNRTKLGCLLLSRNVPQYRAAGYVGIAYSTFQKYVTAKEPIRPHHLRALSAFFEVSPEDIVGLVEDEHGPIERTDGGASREGVAAAG